MKVLTYIYNYSLTVDPIKLTGDGSFGIMGIKQFKVTDDFLSLGMDIKNCGMDSTLEDCVTAKYLGKTLCFMSFFMKPFSLLEQFPKLMHLHVTLNM